MPSLLTRSNALVRSGLFRPIYRSMCWHVQLHAHASLVPYSHKETSHPASDNLIDVLTCIRAFLYIYAVLCTSLVTVEGRRPCLWLTVQL